MASDDFIPLAKVATETGIARTTLYAHIKRGNLKARKVGFFTVVAPSDVAAFKKRLKRVNFGERTITVFQ